MPSFLSFHKIGKIVNMSQRRNILITDMQINFIIQFNSKTYEQFAVSMFSTKTEKMQDNCQRKSIKNTEKIQKKCKKLANEMQNKMKN